MSRTLYKMQGLLDTAKELQVVTENFTKSSGYALMDEADLQELHEGMVLHKGETIEEELYTEERISKFINDLETYCAAFVELKRKE